MAAGRRSALLVVDMQVDFGLPSGSLYVDRAEEVLGPVNEAVQEVERAGGLVVYTQDWHPARTPHFAAQGGIWPAHCVAGTSGAELLPGLLVVGEVIRKGADGSDGYSGFSVRDPLSGVTSPTVLEARLRSAGLRDVVVVGLAGDYCVGETAIDAARLGFTATMPLALTRFVNREAGDHERLVDRAEAAGVTVRR